MSSADARRPHRRAAAASTTTTTTTPPIFDAHDPSPLRPLLLATSLYLVLALLLDAGPTLPYTTRLYYSDTKGAPTPAFASPWHRRAILVTAATAIVFAMVALVRAATGVSRLLARETEKRTGRPEDGREGRSGVVDRMDGHQLFLLILAIFLTALAPPTTAGPLAYGVCQTGCNALVASCYMAAGAVFGTVTAGLGTAPAILSCNAAHGTCMAACAAAVLLPA
ncbi:hypothetical protein DFJ73DRAFT_793749 [Zopfochytrium polystomum]|nr:hypothetical protein DFJ73DRAFT_793749 [Zopfochytrium polystomum]